MSLEKLQKLSVLEFCSYVYTCEYHLPLNIIAIPYCRSPDFLNVETDCFNVLEILNSSILKQQFSNTHIKHLYVTGDNIIIFYTKEI